MGEFGMFKRWFQSRSVEHRRTLIEPSRNGTADRGTTATEAFQHADSRVMSGNSSPKNASRAAPAVCADFEEIYLSGTVKLPDAPYSILKVSEMMDSPHLAGMSPEAKRCALLMAFEAAGVELEVLIKDAMLRQRALNDYEEEQRARLKEFEAAKANENRDIQAELDRIAAEFMRRVQSNTDELARCQDEFEAWQKRKLLESQRIEEAVALCARPGGAANPANMTAPRERAAVSGR
jgi:hypothetical protein